MKLEMALAIALVLAVVSWTQEFFPKEAQTLNWSKVSHMPLGTSLDSRAKDCKDQLWL